MDALDEPHLALRKLHHQRGGAHAVVEARGWKCVVGKRPDLGDRRVDADLVDADRIELEEGELDRLRPFCSAFR